MQRTRTPPKASLTAFTPAYSLFFTAINFSIGSRQVMGLQFFSLSLSSLQLDVRSDLMIEHHQGHRQLLSSACSLDSRPWQ
jgi:hypothetical protein